MAALVALNNAADAQRKEERANHRNENKDEYIFADCKLEDDSHFFTGARSDFRLKQNENDDLEVDDSSSESEDDYVNR